MAFVPGYRYDIFISYAHRDNRAQIGQKGWVDRFEAALKLQLEQKLGEEIAIWRDKERITGNIKFTTEMGSRGGTWFSFFTLKFANSL